MSKAWREYNQIPPEIQRTLAPLNNLTGSEWTSLSKSVNRFNGKIAEKRRMIGAAFPITLAKHMIRAYTAEGNTVLDPFAGVGTTLDAARLLGRHSIGFEIVPEFVRLAKMGVDPVDRSPDDFKGVVKVSIFQESSLSLLKRVKPASVDFILTSPPYSSLLNHTVGVFTGSKYPTNIYRGRRLAKPYSARKEDFGNLHWDEYCENLRKLMKRLHKVAREGSYNAWVVRDYRDMQEHIPYVNLHGKIIELAQSAGWILTDMMIWDQSDQRQLVKLGGPKTRRFYLNIGHSFIVIFRKNISVEPFRNTP
jgi:DNA modification methylase